mmetsp:Transcript_44119/g.125882  ORF Transcript_44119/g.125882 Transcript_44119/m.125882 type:complete len:233 (-) Transcript_44119:310-1008(-)
MWALMKVCRIVMRRMWHAALGDTSLSIVTFEWKSLKSLRKRSTRKTRAMRMMRASEAVWTPAAFFAIMLMMRPARPKTTRIKSKDWVALLVKYWMRCSANFSMNSTTKTALKITSMTSQAVFPSLDSFLTASSTATYIPFRTIARAMKRLKGMEFTNLYRQEVVAASSDSSSPRTIHHSLPSAVSGCGISLMTPSRSQRSAVSGLCAISMLVSRHEPSSEPGRTLPSSICLQ